jgi:hypothetical protein
MPVGKQRQPAMMKNFDDVQKLGQANMETAMTMFGEWTKGWQTVAADMTDYTKRSFEDGTQTFEKLLGAKSIEQAMEIQTSYAKRAYEDYVAHMTKVGGLYTGIAKDAYRPVERVMKNGR